MSQSFTITLTDAQALALSHVAFDPTQWIANFAEVRSNLAIDEIVKISVEKCFEGNIQVPTSKEETVKLAFENGWVKTGVEILAEYNANRQDL